MAMQIAALCYCNSYLTDGFLPRSVVPGLLHLEGLGMRMWSGEMVGGGEDADWKLIVADVLDAGLWEEVTGGYRIHDYHEYQPSKEQVLAEREQKKRAGQKGGLASAQARAEARGQAGASPPSDTPERGGTRRPKGRRPDQQVQAPAQAPAQAESKPVPVPVPSSVVTSVDTSRQQRARRSTTDDRVQAGLDLAAKYDRLDAEPQLRALPGGAA